MNTKELVTKLSLLHPSEVIYEITMETVISAIVRRMGEEALDLSAEDLEMAREEVCSAIDHYERDLLDIINIGIDAFFVLKDL